MASPAEIWGDICPQIFSQTKATPIYDRTFLVCQSDTTALKAEIDTTINKGTRPYLDLGKEQIKALKDFANQKNISLCGPKQIVSVATALRHALSHGYLSPSRVAKLDMTETFIGLSRGLVCMSTALVNLINSILSKI